MQSDDLILPIFFGFVALAMALSLFLWFAKGKRTKYPDCAGTRKDWKHCDHYGVRDDETY